MKRIFFFLMLIISGSVFAQTGKIIGTVRDNFGEPKDGTTVLIKEIEGGHITDFDGKFIIKNIPAGTYNLEASHMGYKTYISEITLRSGQTLELEISLKQGGEILQEVEVTGRLEKTYKNTLSYAATKTATPLEYIPQRIDYVTKELILDQASFSMGDVVKNISGINQHSSQNDFTIRGFRVRGGGNSGMLLNGLRTMSSSRRQQLLTNIERVEVIKGSASALFGNTSPGGTINTVTKKPLAEERQFITSSVGSFSSLRSAIDFTGPLGKKKELLYRLNIGYRDTQGFRDLQNSKDIVIAPSFSFLPSDNTRLNVDLVYRNSRGRLDRGLSIFGNGDLYSVPITKALNATNDFFNEETLNATLSLHHKFNDIISFNSTYLRSTHYEDLLEHRATNSYAKKGDGTDDVTKTGMRVSMRKRFWVNDNLNNYFNINFKSGSLEHKALLGYDYFLQELRPGGSRLESDRGYRLKDGGTDKEFDVSEKSLYELDGNGDPIPNVAHFDLTDPNANVFRDMSKYSYYTRLVPRYLQESHGVYIQDQIKWNDFRILLGLRHDTFIDYMNYKTKEEKKSSQSAIIPRVGMVYDLNKNINIYASWTKGYQPQEAETIQNPDVGGPFDPLISESYEVGSKTKWFDGKLNAELSVYHITQKGTLYNANDEANPDRLVQMGKEVSKGFELTTVGRIIPGWSLNAGYAFNDAKITEGVKDDDKNIPNIQRPNAPKHTFNIWTKYIFQRGFFKDLGFGAGTNYVSERYVSRPESTNIEDIPIFPSYELFNLALYYKIDRVQFQVNFNNVLNKIHWVGARSFIRNSPGKPRNVMVTVSYTF